LIAVAPIIQQALVLTAGLGTRLRPLTLVRAKSAIPVAGVPLIRRIVAWLVKSGITQIVLNLHHLPASITAVVGDGSDLGARVRYSWEQPEVLGSAGGPRLAALLMAPGPFFIVNGDTLTDLDLSTLARAHAAAEALVTMALVPNTEPDRYGGVQLDEGGRVTRFVARGDAARGSFHFIGAQIASPEAFADMTPGTVARSVGGVYDRLVTRRPGSIRGFVSGASFWDIGTVADYWRTSSAFAGDDATSGCGRDAHVAPDAVVVRSILWDGVHVGRAVKLEECIVTDGVHVPAGASYRRAVLRAEGDRVAVTSFDPPETGAPMGVLRSQGA
jgi:mannose-1-phosphate guanylyltransferase